MREVLFACVNGVADGARATGNDIFVKSLAIAMHAATGNVEHGTAAMKTEIHRNARFKSAIWK